MDMLQYIHMCYVPETSSSTHAISTRAIYI